MVTAILLSSLISSNSVKLKEIKETESTFPLFLEGSAYSIYNELSDTQKKSYEVFL